MAFKHNIPWTSSCDMIRTQSDGTRYPPPYTNQRFIAKPGGSITYHQTHAGFVHSSEDFAASSSCEAGLDIVLVPSHRLRSPLGLLVG
jgi:hypothetical protein